MTEPPTGTQYSSFPAYDRVKLEIIDAFLETLNLWKAAAYETNNINSLNRALVSLSKWYFWVAGFHKVKPNEKLDLLRAKILNLQFSRDRGKGEIKYEELTEFLLEASDYLYELKITNILMPEKNPKFYLVEGMAER